MPNYRTMTTRENPRHVKEIPERFRRIQSERKRLRLTQAQLAHRAGVSPSMVYRIEAGTASDLDKIEDVERALSRASGQTTTETPARGETATGTPHETIPSAMGQLVGQMMGAAGGVDPYMTLVEVASANDDPPSVFKQLAELRRTAPPGASHAWWFLRYLDMGGGAKRKPRS